METSILALGLLFLIVSIIANSVLSARSRGKQGWGDNSGLVTFSWLMFAGTLWFGYKIYGWLGAVAAFVLQVVGMVVLSGRISSK